MKSGVRGTCGARAPHGTSEAGRRNNRFVFQHIAIKTASLTRGTPFAQGTGTTGPTTRAEEEEMMISMSRSWRRGVLGPAIAAGIVALCVACEPGEQPEGTSELASAESAITAAPGGTVKKESVHFSQGEFPETMYYQFTYFDIPSGQNESKACTGTVLGPHAILTAAHCAPPTVISGFVQWGASSQSLPVTKWYRDPYVDDPNRPAWWEALNDIQKAQPGGRQGDWPAMHDQAILFVPALTEGYLDANRIPVGIVDAAAPATGYRAVGVGSTGGATRDSVAVVFKPSVAGTITGEPRDGYLYIDESKPGFGGTDLGDSGGPTFGAVVTSLPGGVTMETDRHVVGTSHNTNGALAPLAYDAGISMTVNQDETVRLNQLWVRSRQDDTDGDGLPAVCDADPASPSSGHNLCPDVVGYPSFAATKSYPSGRLQCADGYLPIGIVGRAGSLIDQLALRCRAESCLHHPGTTCADEYTTDPFGGDGGSAFSRTCPAGSVIAGLTGDADYWRVRSIRVECASFDSVASGGLTWTSSLGTVGSNLGSISWGSPYSRLCDPGQLLLGLDARTWSTGLVTALQPICGSSGLTDYAGGTGGTAHALRCPAGTIAIGSVQSAAQTNAGTTQVGLFGIVCGPEADVVANKAHDTSKYTVVHGSVWGTNDGLLVPAGRQPLAGGYYPAGTGMDLCPPGYALTEVNVQSGAMLDRARYQRCNRQTGSASSVVHWLNIGGTGGTARTLGCPTGQVADGLYVRSGWRTDGLALHCR